MIMHFWRAGTSTIFLTCLLLSACAGNKVVNTESIQQQSVIEANSTNESPEQVLQRAKNQYEEAIKAELAFYAPIHLSQAQESITQANDALSEDPNDRTGTALMAAIAAQKFIDDGYISKKVVQENLLEVMAHNKALIALQAPTLLTSEYQDVHTLLLDLIKLIEQGKTADAIRGQPPVLIEMSKLEVKTLKHTHLSEAENLIDQTESINGSKYAPVSLQNAVKLLQDANIFITKNYRNRKGVKKIGEDTLWAAQHAYFVALDAKALMQLSSAESEQYVLRQIDHQNSISQEILEQNLAPQSLSAANSKLLKMIADLKSQLKSSQQALIEAISTQAVPTTDATNDDEVVVLRTYAPESTTSEDQHFNEEQVNQEASSLKADEQSFDDIEQMSNQE